jgi:hypothetical protein
MEQDVDLLTSKDYVHSKAGPEGSLNSAQPHTWAHEDPSKCQEIFTQQRTTFFWDCLALKMKALQSFKMWGTTDSTAQCDILWDFTLYIWQVSKLYWGLNKICKCMNRYVHRCECVIYSVSETDWLWIVVLMWWVMHCRVRVKQHGPWWLHQLLPHRHRHIRDIKMCVCMTSHVNTWSWSQTLQTFEMFECGSSPEQTPLHSGNHSA